MIETSERVKRIDQTRMEWLLLSLVALVCAGLSYLQFRWTGEAAQAERIRLRSGLEAQVQRMVRAFDEEIRESCSALVPTASEIDADGRAEAHGARYRQWAASHDPALFLHVGVAVPERGEVSLFSVSDGGQLAPVPWPANWHPLQEAIRARVSGAGPPPTVPAASTLLETPVFREQQRDHGPGPEMEWVIFELSEAYMREKLLPRLAAVYLNPGADAEYDVSVTWGRDGSVIYSTRPDGASVSAGADAVAGIFSAELFGRGERRRGRPRDEGGRTQWTLAVRHRSGGLDAAVSQARTRNLAISFLLLALLGGTAAALVRFTARSRRLAQMQFRFAAGVSHDLRTPLTAIRGAAYNLAGGVVQEPAAINRYARLILRNAEELTSMIENVLAFSTTLHTRGIGKPEAFAIADVLEHAAASMTGEVEQAGCRMEVEIAPELPVIEGDPMALDLAFRNLIGNAIRHAADGKWIGVSAAPWNGGVEVRVRDRGPGIPEADRARVFEPFYRGDARNGRVCGTGLGLSLVKETVERHRGSVAVNNAPGGGAEFTLRIPARTEAA